MMQPNDANQPRSMEDELRSAAKSLDLESRKEKASGPWGVTAWVLGTIHALAAGALKAVQGGGLGAESLGAATGVAVLFVCFGGIAAIVVGAVFGWFGRLLKLGPHTQSALALVVTVPVWWVVIALILATGS